MEEDGENMKKNSEFTKAINEIIRIERGLRKGTGAWARKYSLLSADKQRNIKNIRLCKLQNAISHEFEQYIREKYKDIYWETVKSPKVVAAVEAKKKAVIENKGEKNDK